MGLDTGFGMDSSTDLGFDTVKCGDETGLDMVVMADQARNLPYPYLPLLSSPCEDK